MTDVPSTLDTWNSSAAADLAKVIENARESGRLSQHDLVRALRKPTLAVLTACPASPGPGEAAIVREARTVLSDMGAKVADASVGNRAALSHALVGGQAVNEFEPNSKAARELTALWDEVKRRVA